MITRITVRIPSQFTYNKEPDSREQLGFENAKESLPFFADKLTKINELIGEVEKDSKLTATQVLQKHFPNHNIEVVKYGRQKITYSIPGLVITETLK